ncbi:mersacidin/lichenicidin family type 2 lantibiotic [Natronoglycomyces albus]|uniref:Mersacidin/lichenicidin family type 2 lantibiotic n=1 Tax=Natronoglycomyces albus TaxID=2811108 RepID=A0A895XSL0_9ACTN|nr:mersacidin/lichenicidin family type 2 lantibiotic [Natronoglycomyces albus]QSB05250.1 mersacidin/lichenicidin family type 2 lantibiotic [Natronoglycomyces albus]
MDKIRAWKDPEYRRSLGNDAPDHPVGQPGLEPITDAELTDVGVGGASGTGHIGTMGCCWCLPWYSGWTRCGLVCNPKQPCA